MRLKPLTAFPQLQLIKTIVRHKDEAETRRDAISHATLQDMVSQLRIHGNDFGQGFEQFGMSQELTQYSDEHA